MPVYPAALMCDMLIEVWHFGSCLGTRNVVSLEMLGYVTCGRKTACSETLLDGIMPLPDDADAVLGALCLGWYLAETRGRNRPDGPNAV